MAHRVDRALRVLVVVQVFVRDHAQLSQPLNSKQARLVQLAHRGVVRQQLRQAIARLVDHRPQPAQVIESEVVEP